MAVYAYKAMDMDAAAVAGTIVADTPRQARDNLRERGLTVAQIQEARPAKAGGTRALRAGRRGEGQVVGFIRELATLLRAGIPLLSALSTLSQQHHRSFRAVVQHLADQVAGGHSLADAMGRQPAYFDTTCVSIVQVGESTGSLETALKRLADFKEKAQRLRSRVTTALVYPAFVCLIGLAVTLFLMTYVVPTLLGTLKQAGKDLPAITQAVSTASDFLVNWWWAILASIAVLVVAVKAMLRTEPGGRLADRMLLRLPLLGELIRKENTSRIAVVLAALLQSGLQFVQALQITRQTVRNRIFRKTLDDYEAAVAAGKDVSEPLKASGVFRPMVVQMLSVGQQAGNVEEMLEQLAEAYDQEVATATSRLTAMIEPLLIVILAILVGFIAFATILPILEISNVL